MKKNNTLLNSTRRIDYKDVETLKKFLDPHSRILPRKKTGIGARDQRKLALAVKHARLMALLPFTSK